MAQWHETLLRQLSELTQLVRSNLSELDRKKIVALVTQDVHGRDVVSQLKTASVTSVNDFNWVNSLLLH